MFSKLPRSLVEKLSRDEKGKKLYLKSLVWSVSLLPREVRNGIIENVNLHRGGSSATEGLDLLRTEVVVGEERGRMPGPDQVTACRSGPGCEQWGGEAEPLAPCEAV